MLRALAGASFVLAPILLVAGMTLTFGQEWGPTFMYLGVASAVVGGAALYTRDRMRQKALERIATLRRTVVAIRNRGLAATNDAQLAAWVQERDAWRTQALAAVVTLNKHESMAFEIIGHYNDEDIIRQAYFGGEHTRQVAFMTADLRRLDEIRQRYT